MVTLSPRSLLPSLLVLVFSRCATAQTTTAAPALSTTLSQSIVSSDPLSGTTTSTTAPPAPTANSTDGGTQDLFLWPPQNGLRQCERVTFAFTKPAVPLTCGIYVTNTSTYLEQVIIAPSYTPLVAGTFSWLVDMPVGLTVNVQVFVTVSGQTRQYTLSSMIVQEGQDNSCFGRNVGQNTQSIISYASSLNESYTYTAPRSSSTGNNPGGGGGVSGGAIAGIVIGVIAGLALLALLVFVLRRRQRRRHEAEVAAQEERKFMGPGQQHPSTVPPATYAQNYAYSVMSGGSGSQHPYKQSAPPGTIAEPMSTTPPPHANSPGSPMKRDSGIGSGGEGTQGLADPNSFLSRANSGKALL